jgi:hypothetical protein
MRALSPLIFLVFAAGLPFTAARAQVTEIYKCVDAGGRPLYTSDKKDTAGKKCELVSREINVVPSGKPPPRVANRSSEGRSSEGFPKESAATRATARERQRDILEKELVDEQQKLAQAKQELTEQESVRTSDERTKSQERLQKYKDNVDLHEKNIEALRRELAR